MKTTIATKKCPIYFPNDIGKIQMRSVAADQWRDVSGYDGIYQVSD